MRVALKVRDLGDWTVLVPFNRLPARMDGTGEHSLMPVRANLQQSIASLGILESFGFDFAGEEHVRCRLGSPAEDGIRRGQN